MMSILKEEADRHKYRHYAY